MSLKSVHFGQLVTQGRVNRYEGGQYRGAVPNTTPEVVPSYKQEGYKATTEDMETILAAQHAGNIFQTQQIKETEKVAAHQGRTTSDPYGQYDREFSPVVTGGHLGGKFDSNNCDWYAC